MGYALKCRKHRNARCHVCPRPTRAMRLSSVSPWAYTDTNTGLFTAHMIGELLEDAVEAVAETDSPAFEGFSDDSGSGSSYGGGDFSGGSPYDSGSSYDGGSYGSGSSGSSYDSGSSSSSYDSGSSSGGGDW